MKNILVISSTGNANAATQTLINALKNDFNITLKSVSDVHQLDLSIYTLAIFSAYDASNTNTVIAVKKCLDSGLQVAQGVTSSNYTEDGSITYNLGITSSTEIEVLSDNTSVKILTDNQILRQSKGTVENSLIGYRKAGAYFDYIKDVIDPNFISLATHPDDASKVGFGYLPNGSTNSKLNSPTKANFWYMGFAYANSDSNAYTDNFVNIIKDICAFANGPTKYRVSGSTLNSKQEPVSRKIRIYNKKSGALLAETISASDGTYSLDLTANDPVYVVCLHDSADTNNSQIQDDIIPILVE